MFTPDIQGLDVALNALKKQQYADWGQIPMEPNGSMTHTGLTNRMRDAIAARNRIRTQFGLPSYALEREDPNMGTMSLVSQGMEEAAARAAAQGMKFKGSMPRPWGSAAMQGLQKVR